MNVQENIEMEMRDNGDAWTDAVAASVSLDAFSQPFDHNQLVDFLLWTERNVYFPHADDGWCYGTTSVPRHPPEGAIGIVHG